MHFETRSHPVVERSPLLHKLIRSFLQYYVVPSSVITWELAIRINSIPLLCESWRLLAIVLYSCTNIREDWLKIVHFLHLLSRTQITMNASRKMPTGHRWRSSTVFLISTISIALFAGLPFRSYNKVTFSDFCRNLPVRFHSSHPALHTRRPSPARSLSNSKSYFCRSVLVWPRLCHIKPRHRAFCR